MPAPPVQLPSTTVARGGWRFDAGAVLQACELIGLHRPVNIRFTAGYSRAGSYRYRGGEHHICVSGLNTLEDGGRFLWHELAHAAQRDARSVDLTPVQVAALHKQYRKR